MARDRLRISSSGAQTLVAALLALTIAGAIEGINPNDRPTLPRLRSFTSEHIDLADHIGVNYEEFGICLLNDVHGNTISNIKYSHNGDVKRLLNEIFTRWLSGRGKRPETWEVFVSCLRAVKLNALVDKIEGQYSDEEPVPVDKSHSLPIKDVSKNPPLSTAASAAEVQPASQSSMGARDRISEREIPNDMKQFSTDKQRLKETSGTLSAEGSKPHHNIKKFEDLKYALLSVPSEEWEDLCRLLGVDEPTITDLKNWNHQSERRELNFCLQEYMSYGSPTWEHVMQVVSSNPINQVVTAKEIGRKHGIDYYSALGRKKPVLARPGDHKIKKFSDLQYSVLSIPYDDWEIFCRLLNIDEVTRIDLKRWVQNTEKWEFCLRDYFKYGASTWEDVMRAVISSPFNQMVTAKEIAKKHGIDFYKAMGLNRPDERSQKPGEHRIKNFNDLKYALLKIPYENWDILCRQLGVDQPTITDLHRLTGNAKKWEFCLEDYYDTGRATWEHVVYAMASEPFNELVLAKKIARDYAINFQAVMIDYGVIRKDEL